MKRVLVSGYIGFNNFGDEAIFYALSKHLKSKNFNVSVLCNNKKEVQKRYKVKTFYYKSLKDILKAIISNDILISGGGSLLQNKTSNFSLFYYLFVIFLAKLFFKKTIIFAQGIEKIKGFFPELITKLILKTCDSISVRDERSQKLLKSWKIDSTLVSDPAYSLVQELEINQNKNDLIVQLRKADGMNDELIHKLAISICKFNRNQIKVLSLQKEYDEKICKKFISELNKINVQADFIQTNDIKSIINLINDSKFMISTRLHGLIVSNALKTKTFALVYDDKVATLCEELKISNIDIKNYTENELDNKLNEFFNHHLNEVHQFRHFDWEHLDNSLKNRRK